MNINQAITELRKIKKLSKAAKCLKERTEEQWRACEVLGFNRKTSEKMGTISDWLLYSFNWSYSPEKEKYWQFVYDQVLKAEIDSDFRKSDEEKQIKVPTFFMTKTTPTRSGYYWWQQRKKSKMCLVKVIKGWDKCIFNFCDLGCPYISDLKGYWSNRPIDRPKEYVKD